ncbi:enoyl-CoA hydratase/isomerase family protein [Myxococcota bacterium]|nr:enoyl-CoA hydratase/isomerase family protein [Myxococcota bacterium]
MRRPDYDRYTEHLAVEIQDRVLRLTLNNPEKLNANTAPMHWALSRIWDDIDADPEILCVVFTGAGDRAFSAGGDPAQMKQNLGDGEHWLRISGESKRIVHGMLACNKPIVARLNGHAVGFGATLALASDITVGVRGAKFGDPHCNTGLVCGDGGALLWAQLAGYVVARDFLFTGRLVTMEEAVSLGLLHHAVPREELDAKVDSVVRAITGSAGRAIQLTKSVLNLPLRQAALATMDLGMANEMISSFSEDHREAVHAMLEKRPAKFTGR